MLTADLFGLQPGDTVIKHGRSEGPMARYRFEGWCDVPAHIRGGRVAALTWLYNGTPASGWESDLTKVNDDPN